MTSEEFVTAIRRSVADGTASDVVANLASPPGRRPEERLVRLSTWFNGLSAHDKAVVEEVAGVAASDATFGFLCVLDGVRAIEGFGRKGTLVLLHVSPDGNTTLLTDPHMRLLHEEFNVAEPEDTN